MPPQGPRTIAHDAPRRQPALGDAPPLELAPVELGLPGPCSGAVMLPVGAPFNSRCGHLDRAATEIPRWTSAIHQQCRRRGRRCARRTSGALDLRVEVGEHPLVRKRRIRSRPCRTRHSRRPSSPAGWPRGAGAPDGKGYPTREMLRAILKSPELRLELAPPEAAVRPGPQAP